MRIPFALKPLFGILLPLLLLVGCMVPSTPPSVEPGTVRISLNMPQGAYQTQHLLTDIKSLVFGLVDVSSEPYFGYADGETFTAIGSRYHAAIAGNGTPGSSLLNLPALGDAQRAETTRYLYVATANNGSRGMTFSNVKPSATARYVAFAAAFSKDASTTAVTAADALGFCQSAPFMVASNGSTTVPAMTMTLDRGLGTLQVHLDIDESTHNVFLSSMSKLVVGLLDASLTREPYLGYESSNTGTLKLIGDNSNPAYHRAVAGYWDTGLFTAGRFAYAGTPLEFHNERGNRDRLLYHVTTSGLVVPPKTRTITFANLKPGDDYHTFAIVFQGGDSLGEVKGFVQSPKLTVQANTTVSDNLELKLGN
ncbi:hypothetical protein D3C72_59470 [compost metagenome]